MTVKMEARYNLAIFVDANGLGRRETCDLAMKTLEPWKQSNEPGFYTEPQDVTAIARKRYEFEKLIMLRLPDGRLLGTRNESFQNALLEIIKKLPSSERSQIVVGIQMMSELGFSHEDKLRMVLPYFPDGSTVGTFSAKEVYPDFWEYVNNFGHMKVVEDTGEKRVVRYHNPNGFFGCGRPGGMWDNFLPLKSGDEDYCALAFDVD